MKADDSSRTSSPAARTEFGGGVGGQQFDRGTDERHLGVSVPQYALDGLGGQVGAEEQSGKEGQVAEKSHVS